VPDHPVYYNKNSHYIVKEFPKHLGNGDASELQVEEKKERKGKNWNQAQPLPHLENEQ
jgi:hypothetical protein